jgi:predicted enzyme related to lactoylglutathione lyase
MQDNAIGWFEIPVENMERAMKFYEKVFDFKLDRHQIGPLDMAWFPFNQEHSFMALFIDNEGNGVALHSRA